MKLLTHQRFLAIYSGVLTVVFVATVVFTVMHERAFLYPIFSEGGGRRADFDQITVHRIDIVEANGTPRMVIANKSEFPGFFFKGKEESRPDRAGQAGLLFLNDEGTENGGLIFGGYKSGDDSLHSWGHLSFDEYEQDETFDLAMQQDGNQRSSGLQLYDNGGGFITPEALDALENAKKLPHDTPEQIAAGQKIFDSLLARYPIKEIPRGYFGRDPDKSSVLRLQDRQGHDRILLRVAPDGTPSMQFLDGAGRTTHEWPRSNSK